LLKQPMENMSKEQKNNPTTKNSSNLSFIKMNATKNDFIIFDSRSLEINLSCNQIQKICDRKNIGCDQLIIIKNPSSSSVADCFMEIYNQDGSKSAMCGNATRCVASLIMQEKKSTKATIETASNVLNCWRQINGEISVEMGNPKFSNNFSFNNLEFFLVDMGNPHAVCFVDEIPADEVFFKIAPQVETNKFFLNRTNVEFAKIIADNLIEVRVWERGAGETLACGSGACAVAVAAIKNNLVNAKKIITRFKGGDLAIEWADDASLVIMTGNYQKIFHGSIDFNFVNSA